MDCKQFLLPLVAFAFASWVISLGGISALQADCAVNDAGAAGLFGVRGFSAALTTCTTVYRYYWFIVAFEFVILAAAAAALVGATCVSKSRATWVGLFAIAALLYIQTADSFLTASQMGTYMDGSSKHRVRAMVAGSIMTAVANLFLVIAFGMEDVAPATTKTPAGIPTGENAA